MKIWRYNVDILEKFKFNVFIDELSKRVNISLDVNLTEDIDYYSYHDAPASVYMHLTYEELEKLYYKIDRILEGYRNLKFIQKNKEK